MLQGAIFTYLAHLLITIWFIFKTFSFQLFPFKFFFLCMQKQNREPFSRRRIIFKEICTFQRRVLLVNFLVIDIWTYSIIILGNNRFYKYKILKNVKPPYRLFYKFLMRIVILNIGLILLKGLQFSIVPLLKSSHYIDFSIFGHARENWMSIFTSGIIP